MWGGYAYHAPVQGCASSGWILRLVLGSLQRMTVDSWLLRVAIPSSPCKLWGRFDLVSPQSMATGGVPSLRPVEQHEHATPVCLPAHDQRTQQRLSWPSPIIMPTVTQA